MKNLIQFFKATTIIVITIMLMASECGKEDDVSGDSHLKIINQCNRTLSIYFDDSKLGTVSSNEDETWDVPSGTHTVKATCFMADDYESTHKFVSDKTITITLKLDGKKSDQILIPSLE